jgi:hypothetical protein
MWQGKRAQAGDGFALDSRLSKAALAFAFIELASISYGSAFMNSRASPPECGAAFFQFRGLQEIFFGHEPELSGGSEVHAVAREALTPVALEAQIAGHQLPYRFQKHATPPV